MQSCGKLFKLTKTKRGCKNAKKTRFKRTKI
uniref:Uncharacterized protein n=1 Tax=Siphoviridae sp. ct6d71 TaxID=2826298 RepID=A0A8S5R2R6_9CAUD|nr:MAG TPA: hypothetical protein [Siphoviridae sp. ct6d71]